jgi:hypothetical protein
MVKGSLQCRKCWLAGEKKRFGIYFIKAPKDYILPADKKKYNSVGSWRNPSKWR